MAKYRPMTEGEWWASDQLGPMLRYLDYRYVARKPEGRRRLRLFACACCRTAWDQLVDERSRRAVEVAERFALGKARRAELSAAGEEASAAVAGHTTSDAPTRNQLRLQWLAVTAAAGVTQTRYALAATEAVARQVIELRATLRGNISAVGRPSDDLLREEERDIAAIAREVFGNPFHPTRCEPGWVTSGGGVVSKLARAVWDERTFDRLPILADALEDAGCTDPRILEHCRAGGTHVRGCWVIDLILGKG